MSAIEENYSMVGCVCLAVALLFCVFFGVFTEIKSAKKERAISKSWNVEKKIFEQSPPVEYKELEATVKKLREKLRQKGKDYDDVFDLLQITNATRLCYVMSAISEMKAELEEINTALEVAFVDAKIHFANNKYIVSKIDDLAFEDCRHYSIKNLLCLKKAYLLLDRHRALWAVKDDDFVFKNFELELEYQSIMADMEDTDGR